MHCYYEVFCGRRDVEQWQGKSDGKERTGEESETERWREQAVVMKTIV